MRVIWAILGCALLVGLIALTPFLLDLEPVQDTARAKVFKRNLAEGVRVGKKGLYGIDVIRCGRCRLEKRRRGPLTFGGLNVLVLEDLRIVLPEEEKARMCGSDASLEEDEPVSSPRQTMAALGLSENILKSQGVARFSGVIVRNLEVCELEGTNVVPVFTARQGNAVRQGLHLEGCVVYGDDVPERVGEALLKVKPRLQLTWNGGSLDF